MNMDVLKMRSERKLNFSPSRGETKNKIIQRVFTVELSCRTLYYITIETIVQLTQNHLLTLLMVGEVGVTFFVGEFSVSVGPENGVASYGGGGGCSYYVKTVQMSGYKLHCILNHIPSKD